MEKFLDVKDLGCLSLVTKVGRESEVIVNFFGRGNEDYESLTLRAIKFGARSARFRHTISYELAKRGLVEQLEYAKKCGCIFDWLTIAHAIEDIDTVKWLIVNGCPHNIGLMHVAASRGLLPVVVYFRSIGMDWNEITMSAACAGSSVEVSEYLIDNGCPCFPRVSLTCNSISMLELLKFKGIPWHHQIVEYKFKEGNLDVAMFTYRNGMRIGRTLEEVWKSPENVLKFVTEFPELRCSRVMREVCRYHSYKQEYIQKFHEIGCPWHPDCEKFLIGNRALKYAYENGLDKLFST